MSRLVLLLTPNEGSFRGARRNMPPLALAQLQGYLRPRGIEVAAHDLGLALAAQRAAGAGGDWARVLDKRWLFDALSRVDVSSEVADLVEPLLDGVDLAGADAVGISMGGDFSLFEIHAALLIGTVLFRRHGVPIVFGGTNVTYLYLFRGTYRELWAAVSKVFRHFIEGPGEHSLAELLPALGAGTAPSPSPLKGAITWTEGDPLASGRALPSLARPDFRGLALDAYATCVHATDSAQNESDFYRLPFPINLAAADANRRSLPPAHQRNVPFLPYIFNHHCPYRCAFCEESNELKSMPWSKEAPEAVADLASLSAAHGTEFFHFFNNTFNRSRTFVRDFCGEVLARGLRLRWSDCARANGLTRELVEMMHRAGCRKLVLGLETASPRLLRYINKHLALDQLRSVLSWCHELGIWVDLEVIVGFPFETEEDFLETYRFIQENAETINFFALNRYFVVPSSAMGTHPERYGMRVLPARSYDDVLARSRETLATPASDSGETNFHVLAFDEIGGRSHEHVISEARRRYDRMAGLWPTLPLFRDARFPQPAPRPRAGGTSRSLSPATPSMETSGEGDAVTRRSSAIAPAGSLTTAT